MQSKIMEEEIFGPIIPVVATESVAQAIEIVNERPRSLALYVFSRSAATCRQVIDTTHSGGACANDVIVHMLNEVLPFGL